MEYNLDDLGFLADDGQESMCIGCTEDDCGGCPYNLTDYLDRDI